MCFSVSSNVFINGHRVGFSRFHGWGGCGFGGFTPGCFGWGFGGCMPCNPWGAAGLGLGYALGNGIIRGLSRLF